MPRPTRILGGETERVSAEYCQILADAVDSHGIKRKDLEGDGRSAQTVWRVLEHKEEPTFAAAERVRQRIIELCPKLTLPPPAVAVRGLDHYEWMKLGGDLMDGDAVAFRRVLQQVRQVALAMRQGREAMDKLRRIALDHDE